MLYTLTMELQKYTLAQELKMDKTKRKTTTTKKVSLVKAYGKLQIDPNHATFCKIPDESSVRPSESWKNQKRFRNYD